MQSAIAPHLVCPRTRPRAVADDHVPPFPAWTSRPDPGTGHVVIGNWGVQWRGEADRAEAEEAFRAIDRLMDEHYGPKHRDRAHAIDSEGHDVLFLIAYWESRQDHARWAGSPAVGAWWDSWRAGGGGVGLFSEVMQPPMERLETLLSAPDRAEGVGHILSGVSDGDIAEHGYWGSMRDRLALAQTDAMAPEGSLSVRLTEGPGRVRVQGHRNVAMIRSGQDWSLTDAAERELYVSRMAPTLEEGMAYLRDHGLPIGCYSSRFAREVNFDLVPLERTFGMSWWHSLADLEQWAEHHPTHVAIFGTFLQMVEALQGQLALKLYHEVTVLDEADQSYVYVNCHPRTGLLAAAG